MRKRVFKLLGKKDDAPTAQNYFDAPDLPVIGTFHSLCVRILRKHIHLLDYENSFAIYDDADQLILMKHIFEDLKISEKEMNPRSVLSHIGAAKNKLIGPQEFAKIADSYFAQKVARLYGPYQERLKKNNALDFDDLLMKTVELFKAQPAVLDQYRERFRYIHVDEYQDTNHAQYILTNLLAAKYRNLCVIGDSDQSIYSWRGADITNILEFERDYPEAAVIKMEQNYRSTSQILDAAQAIIVKNKRRKEKTLWTDRGEGEAIKLWAADNERHEGEMIAQAIQQEIRRHEKPDYRDFVLLYRTNAQSRVLEEVFMRYAIPYKIVGGVKFYQRKEIKDLIAYLRVIANPADTVSLLRIINVPQRQIGPKTLEVLQTFANIKDCALFEALNRAEEIDADLPDAKREKVAAFAKLIRRLQKHNLESRAAALIKFALDETGYKKFLDDGSVEGEARMENVAELVSVAAKYDKLEPGVSLRVFLEEVSLISDLDTLDEKENAVTLMTLHSAKGLEFPWVFICGMEQGLLPHSRSALSPDEMEEERRLFYVGATRAMDRLHLLYAKNRMLYGESQSAIPSQFLEDIPPELIESNLGNGENSLRLQRGLKSSDIGKKPVPQEHALFSDGDRVRHSTFGEGIIVNIAGGVITVAFKNPGAGIKKLAAAIAPLEKI